MLVPTPYYRRSDMVGKGKPGAVATVLAAGSYSVNFRTRVKCTSAPTAVRILSPDRFSTFDREHLERRIKQVDAAEKRGTGPKGRPRP